MCVCVCPGPLCGDSWCGSDPGWKEASRFFFFFHVSLPTIPGAIWVLAGFELPVVLERKKKKKKLRAIHLKNSLSVGTKKINKMY